MGALAVARSRTVAAVRSIDRALAVLSLAGFIGQVGVAVMLPLLPLYARQLGAAPFTLGLLTSSFAILNTIGQLAVGFLSDRFGARRMVPAGLGIYAAANALIATATSAAPLIAFRSIAGFGGGITVVAERIYLARVAAPERLAFTNGILSAAQSAGTVMGPAMAGLLAAASDLRVPFILVAVTSFVAFSGTLFLPVEPPLAGAPAPTVAEAVPGILEPTAPDPTPAGVGDGQPREAARSTRVPLRPLIALLLANLALQAAFGAFITTYAPFGTTRLGWSTAQVGIVFSLFGAGSIVLGPWLSGIADRRGRRLIALVGTLPVIALAPLMVLALPDPVIYVGAVIAGGGLTAFGASWYALLSDASPPDRRGRYFGFISAISTLGIIIGAIGASTLWEAVDISAGLLVASVAIAVAIPALLALPPERRVTA